MKGTDGKQADIIDADIIFTDRSKPVLLWWIFFVIYVSYFSCVLVCSL